MLFESLTSTRRFRLFSWSALLVVPPLIQAALTVTLPEGVTLAVCRWVTYELVLVMAAGIFTVNAVCSRNSIRLFWSFLALAFWVLCFLPLIWIHYLRLGWSHPPSLFAAIPLILQIVLKIAAVASRPHLKLSRQRGYRTTLNFLLLLFFWAFVFALLLVRQPYPNWDTALFLRFQGLYSGQTLFLVAILGVQVLRAQRPWKSIYGNFLGAQVLSALASGIFTIDLGFKGYHSGFMDVPLAFAACWLVWLGLRGRNLAAQLEESVQPDTTDTKYTSLLAMLSVVAIPTIGLWELLRTDEPYRTHEIRLFIVLVSVLFLGVCASIEEYLANRELFSDLGLSNERLRLAMESGKTVGWEWDLRSGRNRRS